jgi:hypothetical protein
MEELTFLDLVVLQRIEPDTVIEKFGTKINSSFFDAANILGTLKQKGYIDFKTTYPGPSAVEVTQTGARMLEIADEKSKEDVDDLDLAILGKMADGHRDFGTINAEINVRSSDLAMHLHKLVKKDLASYVLKSGRVELSLSEEGFKRAGKRVKEESKEEVLVVPEKFEEGQPKQEVKLDKATMRKAKFDYHFANLKATLEKNWLIYVSIILLTLLVVLYLVLFK